MEQTTAIGLATVVSGMSTLAYAIIAAFQWRAIRRQADLAEDGMTKLERPWVLVGIKGGLGWEADGAGNVVEAILAQGTDSVVPFEYTLTNLGRSPAWVFQVEAAVDVVSNSKAALNYSLDNSVLGPLGPERAFVVGRAKAQVTPEQRTAVEAGAAYLVFAGSVRYRDVFGRGVHVTPFRFVLRKSDVWLGTGFPNAWMVHEDDGRKFS